MTLPFHQMPDSKRHGNQADQKKRLVVAWLCPYRFPAWRDVYRRTVASADVLLVRIQPRNPLGLTAADVDRSGSFTAEKPLVVFEGASRWTRSNWRQEFCDRTRELLGDRPATILQFDEDEALSSEQVRTDVGRIDAGADSVWYRFRGPLTTIDGAFDRVPPTIRYPAAPHCKIWRWFPEASFERPRYQGYASPCGIPRQPDRRRHVISEHQIHHLLLATPELRQSRRLDLSKYLQRAKRNDLHLAALRRGPQVAFETWLTSLVGE